MMKPEVLKGWLLQILQGLHFLHTRTPTCIHRDLRCENIYIRSNVGKLKIGGLELGIFMQASHPSEFAGTPGYMPTDLVETVQDPKSDVYAFGMCALEMFTCKSPYVECSTAYQIMAKQLRGQLPEALLRITDETVADFVEKCLLPRHLRPNTEQLFAHPLLAAMVQEQGIVVEPLPVRLHVDSELTRLESLDDLAASLGSSIQIPKPICATCSSTTTVAPSSAPSTVETFTTAPIGEDENIKCYTADNCECIRLFYADLENIDQLFDIVSSDMEIPRELLRLRYLDSENDSVIISSRTKVAEIRKYAQKIMAVQVASK